MWIGGDTSGQVGVLYDLDDEKGKMAAMQSYDPVVQCDQCLHIDDVLSVARVGEIEQQLHNARAEIRRMKCALIAVPERRKTIMQMLRLGK